MNIPERKVPEADFVRYVEEALGKADPDRAIPWVATPSPEWAVGFHPRIIWDLGCGLGAFTEAIILRLAGWGCLDRLKQLVLVEGDEAIHPGGGQGLRAELRQRMKTTLDHCGHDDVSVEVIIANLAFKRTEGGGASPISPLDGLASPRADLVIASHITYYFEDGSGQGITQALQTHHLQPNGRIWCVIRNLDCPIYRKRRQTLKELNMPDPKPYDYGEYFQDSVVPRFEGLLLREAKVHGYNIKGSECLKTGHSLMWREFPGSSETPYGRAVRAIYTDDADPLFRETHFIMEHHE